MDRIKQDITYKGWADGSSVPNPGVMKIGGLIKDPFDKCIYEFSENVGEGTNNISEFLSLIHLLKAINRLEIQKVSIEMDSLLVVNQVNRKWKAKNPNMIQLRDQALQLLESIPNWSLTHIPRSKNKRADSLT
jgi:probable phosphoglycerate mutase